LTSRGWVDPVPDPLLLRKSGSAGNRTRDLCTCSQKLWPLDHKDGHCGSNGCENRPLRRDECHDGKGKAQLSLFTSFRFMRQWTYNHSLLTSVEYADEYSAARPVRFSPREISPWFPLNKLDGPHSRSEVLRSRQKYLVSVGNLARIYGRLAYSLVVIAAEPSRHLQYVWQVLDYT
jgi:hypothetical protein